MVMEILLFYPETDLKVNRNKFAVLYKKPAAHRIISAYSSPWIGPLVCGVGAFEAF